MHVSRLRDAIWKLRQGKYGAVAYTSLGAAALLSVTLLITSGLGLFQSVGNALALATLLFVQAATIYILGRTAGRIADIQSTLSLEHGLERAGYVVQDFFVDESAATPTFELMTLKILLFCQPKRVLELGSGQTTKLLSNYARQHQDAFVLSVEDDEAWFRRFGPQVTHNYVQAPVEPISFKCAGTGQQITTKWYREFPELRSGPFQFILVDGPDYEPAKSPFYRSGILRYLPEILDDTFVIAFDDAERLGDSMTVDAADAILNAMKIKHLRFEVYGSRTVAILCSPNLWFLRTI